MIEVCDLRRIIVCEGEHMRMNDLGERIWLAKGKKANVIYFEEGK